MGSIHALPADPPAIVDFEEGNEEVGELVLLADIFVAVVDGVAVMQDQV